MSVKTKRPLLARRTLIAAAPALALGAAAGNQAAAQTAFSMLPDAADAWDSLPPSAPPPLSFLDTKGQTLSLGAFHGHVLLVNLWATWCGPCKEELPSLASLAARIKPFGGLILPISIDVQGAPAVRRYFAAENITNLPILTDPDGADLDLLNANGVPTTLVINPKGQATARLDGAANWNTPTVLAYLRHLAHTTPAPVNGFTQV